MKNRSLSTKRKTRTSKRKERIILEQDKLSERMKKKIQEKVTLD